MGRVQDRLNKSLAKTLVFANDLFSRSHTLPIQPNSQGARYSVDASWIPIFESSPDIINRKMNGRPTGPAAGLLFLFLLMISGTGSKGKGRLQLELPPDQRAFKKGLFCRLASATNNRHHIGKWPEHS
jgi:hypothetical protein